MSGGRRCLLTCFLQSISQIVITFPVSCISCIYLSCIFFFLRGDTAQLSCIISIAILFLFPNITGVKIQVSTASLCLKLQHQDFFVAAGICSHWATGAVVTWDLRTLRSGNKSGGAIHSEGVGCGWGQGSGTFSQEEQMSSTNAVIARPSSAKGRNYSSGNSWLKPCDATQPQLTTSSIKNLWVHTITKSFPLCLFSINAMNPELRI